MVQLPFRIYVFANLLVYGFFALRFFPEGLLFGFIAFFVSVLVSMPALLLLLCLFYMLERFRPPVSACWVLLCLVTTACAFTPAVFIGWDDFNVFGSQRMFLWLSLASAFAGTLSQFSRLHHYFKFLQHETEEPLHTC